MRLQAALNGPRTRGEHAGVPITAPELARDGAACAALGVTSLHLHPRADDGAERLDAAVVDAVVAEVRAAARIPVGVTSAAWIEPDPQRRVALLAAWREPDFATVNLSEEGAIEAMRVLLERDIGIEAGLWEAADAERLVESGLVDRVLRCLVEPWGEDVALAFRHVEEIHAVLDGARARAPRLRHSDGAAAWPVLRDALARGHETRIGLEDALLGPDGAPATGNAELAAAALALG